ncbi:2-C-methyl-D-erythritol 4-phosphate cytidylyltransferase [Anaerococcus sp. Marseille-P3625]|uniref:2-C-methyl-D-erythritol 4-phosphate cytidylyltransferase n=1 Tax=Anaerococcus sp. Marseille-P3625 TaxID=1977277 RepID=UPI000C079A01|nr:2-C-methyl-D-erythritol 4-phosphate cytidylyltransferase [Anaerococcus sp. Marseille-P3625]
MLDGKYLSAIITAAGSGNRMNSQINKPYLTIENKKIIELTLDKVSKIENFDEIILVIRKEDEEIVEKILENYPNKISYVFGSTTRELSTFEGLKALNKKCQLVLTHDGVRPFASLALFKKVLEMLKHYKAVISATKSKDTIKIVDENMLVDFTPNRDYVYNIQTPQAFDKNLLFSMYEKYVESEFKITDDSQLFEFFKRDIPVKVVDGEYSNIKITTKEDILFAKAYIKSLENEEFYENRNRL